MSVQFGQWNFEGRRLDATSLARVSDMLNPYGPDGRNEYAREEIHALYFHFHTTPESHRESQPLVLPSGAVLTWDGRLDNRKELLDDLRDGVPSDATDADIAAAAYESWRLASFKKLAGDWALSLWCPRERSLILAADFLAMRPLYYLVQQNVVTWCTVLDPLMFLSGEPLKFDEEYAAGWLGFFPAVHLTPYKGIRRVPPASYVQCRPGAVTIRKYWSFDPSKRICYRTDGEYEEHFRALFNTAVRRRLRSDRPVLAELSGGMDSSSIVCVADQIIAADQTVTPRLDTLSYYDDTEPNWNEKLYFTKVEEKRGRAGCHIDVGPGKGLATLFPKGPPTITPEFDSRSEIVKQKLVEVMSTRQNRVILSGTGGDEVLGGVPTALPELADLLSTMHLGKFLKSLFTWSLVMRTPAIHVLWRTLREFLPASIAAHDEHRKPALWLDADFIRRHRAPLSGYSHRLKFFGPPPSFQENVITLDGLTRQLACAPSPRQPLFEKRYPFLDRDLLEFLFSIEPSQLVRPHQRRSLMRRALAGIVPAEILERKRKAFVVRSTIVGLRAELSGTRPTRDMLTAFLGIIDPLRFGEAVASLQKGMEVPFVTMLRTLALEHWLNQSRTAGIMRTSVNATFFYSTDKRIPTALNSASQTISDLAVERLTRQAIAGRNP
jgi:asparagine synthase (glutamine-hydrolysing)